MYPRTVTSSKNNILECWFLRPPRFFDPPRQLEPKVVPSPYSNTEILPSVSRISWYLKPTFVRGSNSRFQTYSNLHFSPESWHITILSPLHPFSFPAQSNNTVEPPISTTWLVSDHLSKTTATSFGVKSLKFFGLNVAKAKLFCLKSFVPVTRAGVFIWKIFIPVTEFSVAKIEISVTGPARLSTWTHRKFYEGKSGEARSWKPVDRTHMKRP